MSNTDSTHTPILLQDPSSDLVAAAIATCEDSTDHEAWVTWNAAYIAADDDAKRSAIMQLCGRLASARWLADRDRKRQR